MNALIQQIKLAIASKVGYIVYGFGYTKAHVCFSRAEALEWMKQYPEGAMMFAGGHLASMRCNCN